MVLRLFTVTPRLLEPRQLVHFSKNWHKEFEDKYFRIDRVQEIGFDRHFIVGTGSYYDFDTFDETVGGLEPYRRFNTLYEVLMGWKPPQGLIYPRIPTTDWFQKLEWPDWVPTPTDVTKRYLGTFHGRDSPYDEPKFRMHLVYGMEPPTLRIYADSPEDEKVVLRQIINRCKLLEVSYEELTPQERDRVREILHHSLVAGGQWGAVT